MPVPNIFGTATSAIPLSQLDTNFATPVTIGNTAVQLGNTVTSFGNVTLTNVTISSGNVTVSAGSNTAPSITTVGDTNTGIFFPAADTIAFSEGGVEAMRIDSSGNVGINTVSPAYKIDAVATDGIFKFTKSGGASGYLLMGGSSANFSYDTSANYAWAVSSNELQAWTAGTKRMVIDASGNVGVGTTPSAWSSATKVVQLPSGCAIATIGPGDVVATQNAYFDSPNFKYASTTGVGSSVYRQIDGTHRWSYAASGTAGNTISFTQAMTLDASGRLLVGTTDTTGVAGNGVKIKSNSVGSTSSVALTLEGTGGDFYAFKCANVDMSLGSISSGGSPYWIFGNATNSLLLLYVNGNVVMPTVYGKTVSTPRNVFIDSSGVLGGISSVRASKNNIAPITDSAWLYQVSPVTFNYRKRDEDGNYLDEVESEIQYGLIAEDVETVRPEFCIYVEKDGQQVLQGVHYDRMISPLIKALQEQQAIIAQLQADVAALKGTA